MLRRLLAVVVLALAGAAAIGQSASALEEPRVPHQVASYFATGLVPRLVDLFGAKAGAELVYDATNRVGTVRRVLSWTDAYLAGAKTDEPTQLTNNWIAAVTASDGTVLGLATVWINPASDQPELADFAPGAALADAIDSAPKGTRIVRDDRRAAWFATDGKTLTPLVSGDSGVSGPTTATAYQRAFTLASPATPDSGVNSGLLLALIVLGVVVVVLALFVLLPDRRRRARAGAAAPEDAVVVSVEPAPEVGPARAAERTAMAQPPVAKSPVVKPEVVKPPVVKPAAVKPPVVKPEVVKPPVVKPEVVKPAAVKPPAVKPPAVKPPVVKPPVVKPPVVKPAAAPSQPRPAAKRAPVPRTTKPAPPTRRPLGE
jgi:hypothetical protein